MTTSQEIMAKMHTETFHDPRNMDYVLAARTVTAFSLIKLGKLKDALSVLIEAENMIFALAKYTLEDSKPPQYKLYLR